MEIIRDVLSPELIEHCSKAMDLMEGKPLWRPATRVEPEYLYTNVIGEVLVTDPSKNHVNLNTDKYSDINDRVIDELRPLVPDFSTVRFSLQMWCKCSGVTFHNDGNYAWAGTIYLNEDWHRDMGGLLVWEIGKNNYRSIAPEYNTLVLNTERQQHTVTPVSHDVKDYRKTIQMFANLPEN
jgi:Rps23 Pro-64 3,4-dihydroxylase Tpa1-like proline 4-hydroxylase